MKKKRLREILLLKYDSYGNIIYYKSSETGERWFKYDSYGREIYSKNEQGDENWYEYDKNGNVILYKWKGETHGEIFYECIYDSCGRMICQNLSDGRRAVRKYNDSNKLICEIWKFPGGGENSVFFDSNGNDIYSKLADGREIWTDYDSNGNKIHVKFSDGYEWWTEYDSQGREIHTQCNDGHESWCEYKYDAKKNILRKKVYDNL